MEKELEVKIFSLTGPEDKNKRVSSEILIHKPADHESLSLRGQLFVVFDIFSAKEVDLKLATRVALEAIREDYYSVLEGSPLKSLEKALLSAKHRLVNLAFGSGGAISGGELDFNAVAAVLWGTVIYLAQIGSSKAYLLREEKLSDIGSSEEGSVSVISGIVKENDTIILGSKKFGEVFPTGKIVESLSALKKAAEVQNSPIKEIYPPGLSVVVLDFKVLDVPSEEEVLRLYDVETVRKRGFLKVKLFLETAALRVANKFRGLASPDRVKEVIRKRILRESPEIYIKRPEELGLKIFSHKPQILKLVIGFLILLFCFSVAFTISKKREKSHSLEVVTLLTQAESKIKSAQDLLDLNNERARDYLNESLNSLKTVQTLEKNNKEAERLLTQTYEVLDKVNKVNRLTAPDLLYDFTIQSKQAQPVAIVGMGEELFVADKGANLIYRLRQEERAVKVEKASVEEHAALKQIVAGGKRLFVLAESGFSLVNLDDGTLKRDVLPLSESWGNIIGFDIYLDNLYFLSQTGQIYKFVTEGGGFSEAAVWLKAKENFEDAQALSVDGDIYVIKKISGEVLKFTRGERVDFKLSEMDKPLTEPRALFTTPDSNFLYILDSGNKRIVIVAKEGGLYQQQFVYSGEENIWNNLKSLWVDEKNTVIYILDGSRVYRVDY